MEENSEVVTKLKWALGMPFKTANGIQRLVNCVWELQKIKRRVANKVCMTCQEGSFWRTVSLLLTVVATSPVVLRWLCDSPRTGCARRTKYMYVARTSNNRVISSGDLYCCLVARCEALRTCRSGFPIATLCKKIYANREADILQENIAEDHKTNKTQFRMLKGWIFHWLTNLSLLKLRK